MRLRNREQPSTLANGGSLIGIPVSTVSPSGRNERCAKGEEVL